MSIADQERIECLPEEDKETQQALVERVLETLLEAENLTENERMHVQDNLKYIHSEVPTVTGCGQSSLSTLDADIFSDLLSLIDIRYKHQSNEEASAPVGQTTGLNCHTRWCTGTDKDPANLSTGTPAERPATVTGNVRNAQAASQRSAQSVVKQRATAFASLKTAESLGPAKVSALVPLMNRCFGFAIIDNELLMVKAPDVHPVLTMYEKQIGKGANHAWTSSAMSIGSLSYIAVQCYQHTCQCQF
ncbi:hypothetical protein BC826DRAFT_975995 [Russula brevipes]|nr:hypothetical protein BC826DRAFT_975995 [Russula brevipes]